MFREYLEVVGDEVRERRQHLAQPLARNPHLHPASCFEWCFFIFLFFIAYCSSFIIYCLLYLVQGVGEQRQDLAQPIPRNAHLVQGSPFRV